jgi:hypothetical protein
MEEQEAQGKWEALRSKLTSEMEADGIKLQNRYLLASPITHRAQLRSEFLKEVLEYMDEIDNTNTTVTVQGETVPGEWRHRTETQSQSHPRANCQIEICGREPA